MSPLPLLLCLTLSSVPSRAAEEPGPSSTRKAVVVGASMAGVTYLVALQDRRWRADVAGFLERRVAGRFDANDLGTKGTPLELLGGPVGIAGAAGGFYLAGWAADRPHARRVGVQLAEAALLTEVAVAGLKYPLGRQRPYQTKDPDVFSPFSGRDSFPSGHTAMAFTMAAVVSGNYRSPWVAAAAYGLAGAVGAGRMVQNRHWPSDVVGGAFLGWGSAQAVLWTSRRRGFSGRLYSDGRGLVLQVPF